MIFFRGGEGEVTLKGSCREVRTPGPPAAGVPSLRRKATHRAQLRLTRSAISLSLANSVWRRAMNMEMRRGGNRAYIEKLGEDLLTALTAALRIFAQIWP